MTFQEVSEGAAEDSDGQGKSSGFWRAGKKSSKDLGTRENLRGWQLLSFPRHPPVRPPRPQVQGTHPSPLHIQLVPSNCSLAFPFSASSA